MVGWDTSENNAGAEKDESRSPTKEGDSVVTPISSSSFYGKNETPPLPQRRNVAGSSYTVYKPPATPPQWRQPEAVDDDVPDLIPSDEQWGVKPSWDASKSYDDLLSDPFGNSSTCIIDGRDFEQENGWWDPNVDCSQRPGPGMLPPMMESRFHNPEHTLFAVTVTPPDIRAPSSSSNPIRPPTASSSPTSSSSSPVREAVPSNTLIAVTVTPPGIRTSSSSSDPITPPPASSSPTLSSSSPPREAVPSSTAYNLPHTPPTSDEVYTAIPHPNAYYCRKHNGWVLLMYKSSSIAPSLAPSFTQANPHSRLPPHYVRKRTTHCLREQYFGKQNKTHHFHSYEKAFDATRLSTPYQHKSWEIDEKAKHSRRRMAIGADSFSPDMVLHAVGGDLRNQADIEALEPSRKAEDTTMLLDLYVCCQCCLYVTVSDVIPGVIPVKFVEDVTSDKASNPSLGKNGPETVMAAWETILTAIENVLWKGIRKSLAVDGKAFKHKLGWNSTIQKIFEILGFTFSSGVPNVKGTLSPPIIDRNSTTGRSNRERLLRAWVECSAFLGEYSRRFALELKNYQPHTLWVKIESARENYQHEVGAHNDQIARGPLPDFIQQIPESDEFETAQKAWSCLGLNSSAYDTELFQFAYFAQCRCDPRDTEKYFTAATIINVHLKERKNITDNDTMLAQERSRGRFSGGELDEAGVLLGFGDDNDLRVELTDDVHDEFIIQAWRDKIRRSWTSHTGVEDRRDFNEALRMIAQSRGSRDLFVAMEQEQRTGMTPDKAYQTLEVPPTVDDEMLITVYNMRIEEQPGQLEKMRDALRVISEASRSERLQKFLETGRDPGDVTTPTRPDWPRGLNQLGNTCYLNSLLQYFYTIKDLRHAISPFTLASDKIDIEEKFLDDDLRKHRVGGRMVTRSEVIRSRKFVGQLAQLFNQMELSGYPSVTPTLDLAKLALVTSKDEEEEDGDRGGTDSSHSTDATLVDETVAGLRESPQPQIVKSRQSKSPSPSLSRSPSSVLGKRNRGVEKKRDDSMAIDGAFVEAPDLEKDGFVLVSKAPSSPVPGPESRPSGSDTPMTIDDDVGDVEMPGAEAFVPSKAPALPPRPKTQGSSDMMFGKQHDVAECMDNCMFQIETALLKFGDYAVADSDKTSIVKRLFYGKIRQRLGPLSDSQKHKASVHEKEDYFAHLPVNVFGESFDLYDGLNGYFEDVVEFDGEKAKMEVSLVDLPPILQIQLQRVQFDRETMQAYKSHAYVKFGESLRMDRFLYDAPPEKKANSKAIQTELNHHRERIQTLTLSKYESIDDTWAFLSKQDAISMPDVDESFLDDLKAEKASVELELEQCRTKVTELKQELEDVWAGDSQAEYELTSVFVHRGASPSFGHYFIYQRWLPDNPDSWFKYNDSDVSLVSKEEVLADTTGSTANPYLLVFARKGSDIIKTVQRADAMES